MAACSYRGVSVGEEHSEGENSEQRSGRYAGETFASLKSKIKQQQSVARLHNRERNENELR